MDEDTDAGTQDEWAYFLESQLEVTKGVANGMPWSGNERNHLYFGGVPGFSNARSAAMAPSLSWATSRRPRFWNPCLKTLL